jgi:hypothetical protein
VSNFEQHANAYWAKLHDIRVSGLMLSKPEERDITHGKSKYQNEPNTPRYR